jgi:effector-binding domain-containing protein
MYKIGLAKTALNERNQMICRITLLAAIICCSAMVVNAKDIQDSNTVQIKTMPAQVVLYTIYRGDYNDVGQAIGKLFGTAGQNGLMPPKGPLALAYLNNPQFTEPKDRLTEIRIPVSDKALAKVGKFGEFTDVKKIKPFTAAVIVKKAGTKDPGKIYQELMIWVNKNGYQAIEGPFEIFTSGQTGNYESMQTEIAIPVEKAK